MFNNRKVSYVRNAGRKRRRDGHALVFRPVIYAEAGSAPGDFSGERAFFWATVGFVQEQAFREIGDEVSDLRSRNLPNLKIVSAGMLRLIHA